MEPFTKRYEPIRNIGWATVPDALAALHDVRNLLTALAGHLPALRTGQLALPESLAVASIVEYAMQLSRPVDTRGESRRTDIDVTHLVGRLSPVFLSIVGPGARLVIHPGHEHRVRADRPSLESAILNLVCNGATAAGRLGTVWVRVGRHGDTLEIEVANDGPPIDPGIVDVAFGSGTGAPTSCGLGLSIVRGHAARLGAGLRVSSDSRRTSFVLELPALDP